MCVNDNWLIAVLMGNKQECTRLLQDGQDVNEQDEYGYTALIKSVVYANLDMVKYLCLEAHADVNILNDAHESALLRACAYGYMHIVTFLVENTNVNVNCLDAQGSNALFKLALWHYNEDSIMYLIQAGVRAYEKDYTGFSFYDMYKTRISDRLCEKMFVHYFTNVEMSV